MFSIQTEVSYYAYFRKHTADFRPKPLS